MIDGIVIMIANAAIAFIDVLLSLHLADIGFTPGQIGLVFLLGTGCYATTTVILVFTIDKLHKPTLLLLSVGCVASGTLLSSNTEFL